MEIWNPADGTVTLVTDELPPEEGDSNSLDFSQLVPIDDGSGLLLYGGNQVTAFIYSFSAIKSVRRADNPGSNPAMV
jgi:hypothetical protein